MSKSYRKVLEIPWRGNLNTNLYNKTLSNQLQSHDDEIDTLKQRIEWWIVVFGMLQLISNDVICFIVLVLYTF